MEIDGGVAQEAGDFGGDRIAVDVGRGVDLGEAVVVENRDTVAERHRLLIVLGDVEDGGASLFQEARQFDAHLVAQLGVDISERIVEQQQLRAAHQGAGEGRALFLAVGERFRQMGQHMIDLQELGDPLHTLPNVGLGLFEGAERARDVVEGGEVGIEGEVLERHAQMSSLRRLAESRFGHRCECRPHRVEHTGDEAKQDGLCRRRSARKSPRSHPARHPARRRPARSPD